ncbi:MAG: hypothetical protein LBN23_01945, partial [Paludibacter sp.]|nr:hypothetical protein [Paludibacter sp.]
MNYKKLFFLLSAFFATCFANLYATDYYWVGANGGSNGTWSELTSWKLKNGLPPPFLPTNNDNVYFDVNSFGATAPSRTVTINASVSCDSLIFVTSGANAIPFGTNPILALNGTIYASGSVQLKAGMTTSGNGTLILNSTGTTETLDLAEVTFNPGLTIEDGAKWTVTGNLTLNNASVASIFTYKNHNSLTINGNLKAGVLIWGDGTAATRDSLTVNGDLLLFYSQSAGTNSRFDYGGTLKVTGNMDTGMYFYFTYSENMNIGGNYRSDYYFYFQNNTGGINIGGSFNTYRDYNHTNSGGGLTVGTSFTVGTYQSSFNFTGNTGDVVIGTTMTTGEFTFSSTAPGVGNLTIGESYTLNTGNYLDFKFNSPGDITVGSAATIGNPVFTVMSSKLTNAPRYQSIRIHGNGTKTFYGNVSSAYGAKFIDGTVDIKGNLNLGNYTAAYFSDYQSPSLIFGNCKLRVRGDVTGAGYLITGGYNMTGGETHPTTWDVYPETEVTVDGNFTLANLEIRGGITNIGGTLTLTPYNPNDSITRRSLSVLGGTLNFPNAPAVPATINCASDFRVTGNNAISNTRTGGILTSTSTTAANYTYTGGTTVPGGVTNGNVTGLGNALINVDYNYIFTSPGATVLDTTTATVTSPRLVRIKYGSFTARAGDAYRDLEFTDHNGYSIHNVNMGSFNRIEVFQGPASFSYAANISADSLLIHPRETQWFSRTTNVNKHLRIRPDDCGGVIPVNNGIIAMGASSSVDASTLQLKNNHITGPGMDYPVARSIDDGGNSGWDIQAFSGQNLYWVGGAGNWDDPRHWSL